MGGQRQAVGRDLALLPDLPGCTSDLMCGVSEFASGIGHPQITATTTLEQGRNRGEQKRISVLLSLHEATIKCISLKKKEKRKEFQGNVMVSRVLTFSHYV